MQCIRFESLHVHSLIFCASRKFASGSNCSPIDFTRNFLFSSANRERCVKLLKETESVRPRSLLSNSANVTPSYSVLVPMLLVNDKPSILFTLRSAHLPKHAGEVSFPGGNVRDGESLLDAALRETHEEVGLDLGLVDVWGQLTPSLTSKLDRTVTPYVALLDESVTPIDLLPCVNEVELVFTRTVEDLCKPSNVGHTQALLVVSHVSRDRKETPARTCAEFSFIQYPSVSWQSVPDLGTNGCDSTSTASGTLCRFV